MAYIRVKEKNLCNILKIRQFLMKSFFYNELENILKLITFHFFVIKLMLFFGMKSFKCQKCLNSKT